MTISAKVIAHSKSSISGKEVVTFELEFPRIILSEFNTHNALSKNASSSRAIPVSKMLEQVRNNPAMPVRFGKKNKGMQDAGEHNELVVMTDQQASSWGGMYPEDAWRYAANIAADFAQAFDDAGYAKQICNRLIEPFQMMKVVMTATELNNFIWLRDHPAADPTIEVLAKAIKKAKEESIPVVLQPGDWHLPYFFDGFWREEWPYATKFGSEEDGSLDKVISFEDALAISASCCAQTSFRSLDDSLEKAKDVVNKLNLGVDVSQPCHASPTEHQATPINYETSIPFAPETWQQGITHVDRNGVLCSGNLKGFVQYRHTIKGNTNYG